MATPTEIFEKLATNIAKNPEMATSTNAIFGFDISGDGGGQWSVDLREGTTENFVQEGLLENANVTISMKTDTWTGIFSGKSNPMQAFMMGKIKVKGDMGLAMKLQNIISLGK